MMTIKYIIYLVIALTAIYVIGRLFTRGVIDEIEKHLKSHYKQFINTKKNGTEN